jgi:hypothetical protein
VRRVGLDKLNLGFKGFQNPDTRPENAIFQRTVILKPFR